MIRKDNRTDTCGCCEGVKALTPAKIENLPGLAALAYRVGTHARFKTTLLSTLSGQPALGRLTTRDDDDPAIALCDAWAMVLDVLSFYQERIANEGYLRTATERRSILEMARSIGYELRPGVAAGTYLAFTLETAKGSPPSAQIKIGTRAQSIPGQDELPQVFETTEEIKARVAWNALSPRLTAPQKIGKGATGVYLKGTDTRLQPGDGILLVGDERDRWPDSERWDFRILQTVVPCERKKHTLVTWEEALGHETPTVEPADNPRVFAFRKRAALFGHNAPDWRAMSEDIRTAYAPSDWATRKQWPDFKIRTVNKRLIDLDAAYPKILEGGWIALMKPDYIELYKALKILTDSRTDFTLTSKTTRIELDTLEHLSGFDLRDTVVFAESEPLALAEQPLSAPVFGNTLDLTSPVETLEQGRTLIVSGKPVKRVKVAERSRVVKVGKEDVVETEVQLFLVAADASEKVKLEPDDILEVMGPPSSTVEGRIQWHLRNKDAFTGVISAEQDDFIPLTDDGDETVSEAAILDRTEAEGDVFTLILTDELQNVYRRDTVTVNANVAKATHGETKKEIPGSGDGSRAFQKFELKQKPLTHVSAATPGGTQSTMELRVNDLLWEDVPSLCGQPPGKRVYITRLADDGTVTVQFGDAVSGARPPTGSENITATYRVGTGLAGMVKAGQISMLMTPTLGVKGVVNPLAPAGAADPEKLDNARRNAPLTVLTFDRIVSLRDYEDFARAFAGIGKAQANMLWDGERRLVHITVAGAEGGGVPENSELYTNLLNGMDAARHPEHRVKVDSYVPLTFDLTVKVRVDGLFIAEDVLAAVKTALVEAFSFEKRSFGQAVTVSEVLAIMQGVRGVEALDLDELNFTSEAPGLQPRLPENMANWEVTVNQPAKLLTVNPDGITLTEMTL